MERERLGEGAVSDKANLEFCSIKNSPIPEMLSWGAEDGERSYCISFDNRHPHLGYRASWKSAGVGQISFLPEAFPSFSAARGALLEIQAKKAH